MRDGWRIPPDRLKNTYEIDQAKLRAHRQTVPERDVNEEASRLVNEVTESEPCNGEDLIESEELKRQFREAKEREAERTLPD